MNTFINYTIESSIVLAAFILLYKVLYIREKNFSFVRKMMLTGLFLAVVLPLIDIKTDITTPLPSINKNLFGAFLPEIIFGNRHEQDLESGVLTPASQFGLPHLLIAIYWLGVLLFLVLFIRQFIKLMMFIRGKGIEYKGCRVVTPENQNLTFSFFKTIVIGNVMHLSNNERDLILRHEKVHADQFHSIDIIILDLAKIFFWFNPLIGIYKQTLVQLHEFEADARAVEDHDVDQYCSLMAKVALQSSGLHIASHFHQSLTLKRILMVRTAKNKIRNWKIIPVLLLVTGLTITIACEEQSKPAATDEQNIPEEAYDKFEFFRVSHEGMSFMVENDSKREITMATLLEQYGEPVSRESFSVTVDGKERVFELLEYSTANLKDAETVVDEMPEFPGGFEKMVAFMQDNLLMPSDLKTDGKTMVAFVVEKDGSISSVEVLRGFDADADAESVRVVRTFPKWVPGKKNGAVVRTKMVLPVVFKH